MMIYCTQRTIRRAPERVDRDVMTADISAARALAKASTSMPRGAVDVEAGARCLLRGPDMKMFRKTHLLCSRP